VNLQLDSKKPCCNPNDGLPTVRQRADVGFDSEHLLAIKSFRFVTRNVSGRIEILVLRMADIPARWEVFPLSGRSF
jgi:hypothetical protein